MSLSADNHSRLLNVRRRTRKQRQVARRLFAESLERRLLLTTITGENPAANSFNAAGSTDISATFDQDVVVGTATPANFVVHGSASQGRLSGAAATVSAAGPVITSNPTNDFSGGEIVRVTATAGISTTGGAANKRVWQFRTASGGSGQFADGGSALGNNPHQSVAVADVDGDGDMDLALGGSELWLNDGSGGFTDSGQSLGGGVGGNDVEFVDVDGDTDLDFVVGNRVLTNDGTGVFTNTNQNLGGGSATVGDLDGDGDLDVMTGVRYAPNQVWLNNGSGQFTSSGQAIGNGSTDRVLLGDLDGDGDLDAFEALNGIANKVWVNDGSGVFSDTGQALGGFRATKDADIGDIDGDGDLDVIGGNVYSNTGARVYLNDGSGIFAESGQVIGGPTGQIYSVRLADMDGDADLDVVAFQRVQGGTEIWLNDGSGTFVDSGQRLRFGTDITRRIDYATVGDIDSDGDLDLVEVNFRYVGGARLWFNQNLTPSVSIGIDNPSVNEAAGTATVTATLSATHTDPVTIDFGISGTATATDDYTVSGTQIVIPVGATTGTITLTAVQDTVDEPDETVIIDISGVTNGQESGTQQVTATIVDDDEPIPVPDVTLAVDNAAIAEADGTATFTANLSIPTTVPVAVDLGISGTADASDFTASGTQIVIAPGATSGSITVTAVQDAVDEPDETVVVDITSVAGGTESGTQQQMTTITDDDEPPSPDVTLAVDTTSIVEAAGVATFTITLSQTTTVPVTVDLGITGTAAAGDFTASATQVVIAAGATSSSVTVTAVQDEVDEPDETVIVDITNVVGGAEAGEQQQTITILDDDIPPSFTVTSLAANASGFHVEFASALDASDINLYDTQNAGLGAADAVLTGAASGSLRGSLVLGESSVTFITSGEPLLPDTYTVTLRSAADGFKDTGGMLLDGNADGTAGDDYVGNFTIDEGAAQNRSIQIPDFVRGPGQDVNLPADLTTGIPVVISDGANVRAVDLRISYDPALLAITGATAPAGGTVVLNSSTPGLAILVYFSTASLPAGETTFINLQATVPAENASAIYGSQQVLDLHDAVVGDGNDNEFPVVVDDAFHAVSYFADVSGNGRVNASDAAQVARFAALIDTGFATSLTADPIVVGDISGNGRINAADASRLAQFAALIDVPEIPPIPGGIVITGIVPDVRTTILPPTVENISLTPAAENVDHNVEIGFEVVEGVLSSDANDTDRVDAALDTLDERDGLSSTLEEAIDELLDS